MSLTKTSSLQTYHLGLFRSAIHPEFFQIEGRCRVARGDYEFEAWIFKGGHSFRFEHQGLCLSEVVSEELGQLPERGHIITLPCAGEKDHEAEFSDRIGYMTSVQTETLTDHLYLGTYNEMLEHGRMGDCLMSMWTDDLSRPNLSLIDVQRYGNEIHAQAYHLRSDCGLILRTQTIFQVI
ncbi:MAG: hypothetical protein GY715_16510 [Planctomycetes bacterium]|nr:hypothetical protein [Planctomycetota bacterium]